MDQSAYAFYFSRGVVLEAEVLARYLKDQGKTPQHLVQIYRDTDVGRAASQALTHALEGSAVTVENRALKADGDAGDELRSALSSIKENDLVMFWLRLNDVAILEKMKPVAGAKNYFSAHLGNPEHGISSADWNASSRWVYPYELPELRQANLAYFRMWLNMSKVPLVDEAMQSEVFFSLNYFTDTVSEMLNNMYRDYLLERAENMLNKREGSKAEQENRDRGMLGRPGDMAMRLGTNTRDESVRIQIPGDQNAVKSRGTTIYPRMSLGPGQRFASKGGYIVHFAEGNKLVAESAWIVP
jgi:hypothetical protein